MDAIAVRPAEAARAIGISRSTIYELIAAGQIAAVKVGSATVIPVESLREFLEAQRAASGR